MINAKIQALTLTKPLWFTHCEWWFDLKELSAGLNPISFKNSLFAIIYGVFLWMLMACKFALFSVSNFIDSKSLLWKAACNAVFPYSHLALTSMPGI